MVEVKDWWQNNRNCQPWTNAEPHSSPLSKSSIGATTFVPLVRTTAGFMQAD